jgi:hypothetical protein
MRIPFLLCLLLTSVMPLHAAEFLVSTTADSGQGSLRAALLAANAASSPPHTVRFAPEFPSLGLIVLESDLPVLDNGRLNLVGNGRQPRISGAQSHRLLRAGPALTVLSVEGIELLNGRADSGGCIGQLDPNQTASLFLTDVVIGACRAVGGNAAPIGGGVRWSSAGGLVIIARTRFYDNVAASPNNVVAVGGAAALSGLIEIADSSFSANVCIGTGFCRGGAVALQPEGLAVVRGNRFEFSSGLDTDQAENGAGGALSARCDADCEIDVDSNYFVSSAADTGGALSIDASVAAVRVALQLTNNTLVQSYASEEGGAVWLADVDLDARNNTWWGNSSQAGADLHASASVMVPRFTNNALAPISPGSILQGPACDLDGAIAAPAIRAGNLYADASCGVLAAAGGQQVADFLVDTLDESQRVGVLRFEPDSAAVDGGDAATCVGVDARGATRPSDGDGDGNAVCDVGAYEYRADAIFGDGFEA